MTNAAENPRAVIGGNVAPLAKLISDSDNFAQEVTDFLRDRFAGSPIAVAALLEEARELPDIIADDADKGKYTSLIKRIRDEAKRLGAYHEKEATNYLRGKQAVDQYFFGLIDKCSRRDKKNKPGAADILLARLNDYDTRVLAAEQARRRAEFEEAERVRLAAEAEAQRLAEEAEQARLAAERARAPAKIEEKAGIAATKGHEAVAATIEANVATTRAEDTRFATFAKPAEIMRTRGDDGTLSTMATEPYAEVVDADKLDKDKLWPFIKLETKEQALRAWAKNTGHTQQMDGAKIGKRPKSVVR